MIKALIICTFCLTAPAQTLDARGTAHPVEDGLFRNCNDVMSFAMTLTSGIKEPVFFIQLFPSGHASLFSPFVSDGTSWAAAEWVAKYQPLGFPYALLYRVDGTFVMRCRDYENHLWELTSSERNPLIFNLPVGQVRLLHFYKTIGNVAHVFAVTDIALSKVAGDDLLAAVTQELGARIVFLYVRNDPWFFGYAPDSLPYIFADMNKKLTEKQYEVTRSMVCVSGQGCRVRLSQK